MGIGHKGHAAVVVEEGLHALAQTAQHFTFAVNDHVGIGAQPTEIHRIRNHAMGALAGDMAHHRIARSAGRINHLDHFVQFPLTEDEVNTFHCFS